MDNPASASGRERMPNPNFHPTNQPASPLYAQPAAQQPRYDPFISNPPNRDPFKPNLPPKRDALPSAGRYADASASEGLQASNAPPLSPFRTASSVYLGQRRNSGSSFRSGPMEPPPAPSATSMFGRQMPPPMPSPKRDFVAPFSSGSVGKSSLIDHHTPSRHPDYDPGPSRARAGSGAMSINSIVDSGSNANQSAWSLFGRRPSPTPINARTTPSSPRGLRDYDPRRDATTPSYSATLGGRNEGRLFGDMDRNHNVPRSDARLYPRDDERVMPGFSTILHSYHQASPVNGSGQPPRSYSQPISYEPEYGAHSLPAAGNGRANHDTYRFETNRLNRQAYSSNLDARDRYPSEPDPRPPHSDPLHRPGEPSYAERINNSTTARYLGRTLYPTDGLERNSKSDGVQFGAIHSRARPSEHDISPISNRGHSMHGPENTMLAEAAARATEMNRARLAEHTPTGSVFGDRNWARDRQLSATDANPPRSIEDYHVRGRAYLGPSLEYVRNERSSPLPQAVQGAQGQPAGSGRDPGIKSEFGKMFSGLGSGTPQPSLPPRGPSSISGSGRSPFQADQDMTPSNRRINSYVDSLKASTVTSRGGKKAKRPFEDDRRPENDSADGRLTLAAPLTKATKRNKYTQSSLPPQPPALSQPTATHVPHHHHHLQGLVHHHHHVRAREDERASSITGRTSIGSNKTFNPTQTTAAARSHHHVHGEHHHHIVPHAAKSRPPPIAVPVLTVKTSPVLRAVSHLPRNHLGSQPYAPHAELPTIAATTIDSTRMYDLAPNPLPRFEREQANSTFTIRVPCAYLSGKQREVITSGCRVWGTEVYTDDSDPITAAIHSGFIRGAWGVDIDDNVVLGLDMASTDDKENNTPGSNSAAHYKTELDPRRTLDAPPPRSEGGPLIPPPCYDAHITLLILPPLERYDGAIVNGVKSRNWGSNHDGMSFKVIRVEWVSAGKERGAAAKKSRMRAWAADGKNVFAGVRSVAD